MTPSMGYRTALATRSRSTAHIAITPTFCRMLYTSLPVSIATRSLNGKCCMKALRQACISSWNRAAMETRVFGRKQPCPALPRQGQRVSALVSAPACRCTYALRAVRPLKRLQGFRKTDRSQFRCGRRRSYADRRTMTASPLSRALRRPQLTQQSWPGLAPL